VPHQHLVSARSQHRSQHNKKAHTHVNIVTALLGTVRNRFTDKPLYSPVQPSFTTSFRTVYITPPRRTCRGSSTNRASFEYRLPTRFADGYRFTIPSELTSSASGRLCVCSRVRITSCGYVAMDAVILDTALQINISRGAKGLPVSRATTGPSVRSPLVSPL
jgi:hypothetical protein